jgi:hypothetical protein
MSVSKTLFLSPGAVLLFLASPALAGDWGIRFSYNGGSRCAPAPRRAVYRDCGPSTVVRYGGSDVDLGFAFGSRSSCSTGGAVVSLGSPRDFYRSCYNTAVYDDGCEPYLRIDSTLHRDCKPAGFVLYESGCKPAGFTLYDSGCEPRSTVVYRDCEPRYRDCEPRRTTVRRVRSERVVRTRRCSPRTTVVYRHPTPCPTVVRRDCPPRRVYSSTKIYPSRTHSVTLSRRHAHSGGGLRIHRGSPRCTTGSVRHGYSRPSYRYHGTRGCRPAVSHYRRR